MNTSHLSCALLHLICMQLICYFKPGLLIYYTTPKILVPDTLVINSLRLRDAYMRQEKVTIGSDNGLSPSRRLAII